MEEVFEAMEDLEEEDEEEKSIHMHKKRKRNDDITNKIQLIDSFNIYEKEEKVLEDLEKVLEEQEHIENKEEESIKSLYGKGKNSRYKGVYRCGKKWKAQVQVL